MLDRQSQELVLENIKSQISNRWKDIVGELRATGESTLPEFLDDSGVELSDVVRADRTWTRLRRDADLPTRRGGEPKRNSCDVCARSRTLTTRRALPPTGGSSTMTPPTTKLPDIDKAFARMLLFSLWPDGAFQSFENGLTTLQLEPAVRDDLRSVIDVAFDRARHTTYTPRGQLENLELRVHARYQREEILAALDYATLDRAPSFFREGVLRSTRWNADAFFITLKKSETDYSPTTMYQDYAISPDLFHWESQSTTSADSRTGQRYIHHKELGSAILLFTRERKTDAMGTSPYMFLGPATYVSHTGDRPMGITWKLEHPMPMDMFTEASVAVS